MLIFNQNYTKKSNKAYNQREEIMMRNNYAASGLKGIRVAVGMYNRRNGNLETGEITCRMFADRNSEPERFENENTFILYNSICQVEAPSMQDIVSIFYAKQMQAFSDQQLDASCLNQHTKEVIAEQCANRKSRLLRIKNKLENYEREVDATIARLAM